MEWPWEWDQSALGTFLGAAGVLASFVAVLRANSARRAANSAVRAINRNSIVERHGQLRDALQQLTRAIGHDERNAAEGALDLFAQTASELAGLISEVKHTDPPPELKAYRILLVRTSKLSVLARQQLINGNGDVSNSTDKVLRSMLETVNAGSRCAPYLRTMSTLEATT